MPFGPSKRRRLLLAAVFATAAGVVLPGCAAGRRGGKVHPGASQPPAVAATRTVWYEIFVRSFADANGDGVGDLAGVAERLDYLEELGVGGIWLTPIFASPTYHGYDTSDYYAVNPDFGTIADVRALVTKAHARGIRVILDLAANHTSSRHPWFVESAASKASRYRSWYTWAEDTGRPLRHDGAIPSEPWHEQNGAHYLGIFDVGMPDLNFDNPEVRGELVKVGRFWTAQGIDGLRLDAAKHVYEDFASSATDPKVVRSNREWWTEFRTEINATGRSPFLVGEVWDAPAVIAPYLGIFDAAFNFGLAKKLVRAASEEKAQGIAAYLGELYRLYDYVSGNGYVDAPFLTNHDQDRVMNEVEGSIDRARSAASLLLTMPGRPFLYYGEEIGMRGAKPDEAIREPMVWNLGAKPGRGQTAWEPIVHNADGRASVDAERDDPRSLLRHYRRLIAWRNAMPGLQSKAIAPFDAVADPSVELYVRGEGAERVLVAINLSARAATVTLPAVSPFARVEHATPETVTLDASRLALPPYATALLRP